MKFLHTADWHIGRKLNGFYLLEEQRDALEKLMDVAEEEQVDAIVIAGDVFDRAVPPVEAVQLFNQILKRMNREKQFPVLMISGNHDSATRLATGSSWYKLSDLHLHTNIAQSLTPVVIGDTQFFLLPYFEPFEVRHYFQDETIRTVDEAMTRLVDAMAAVFEPDMQHVLVSHFFAAGSERSDSETKVEVGGLNAIPVDKLTLFDYVALGHLHSRTALHHPSVKYSGSLLKYSLSERNQTKGVWLVTLSEAGLETRFREITPLRDVVLLEGSFDQLTDAAFYQHIERDDYIAVSLTDKAVIPNVMQHLRDIYPRIIGLERTRGNERARRLRTQQDITRLSPLALMSDYFKEVTGEPVSAAQKRWLKQTVQGIQREE